MWIESKNLHLQITQVSLSESAICPSFWIFKFVVLLDISSKELNASFEKNI